MSICGATYSCCECRLETHEAQVPHRCYEDNCQGSWNWVDGEFVAVELPRGGDPLRALMSTNFSIPRGGIRYRTKGEESE